MVYDLNMLEAFYSAYKWKIEHVRAALKRPLTLAEKILYAHLYHANDIKNYERGEEYFGDEFRTRYGEIITVLQRHIINGKGSILDLSYLLPQGDFICLRSTNEGILEHGRKLIAEKIVERMKKGCQSEWSGH